MASVQFMLFQLGRIAVVLLLPAIALSTVAGMDLTASVIAVGLLCVVYTMFGGMAAVIWTDVVQTVILMGGAVWALMAITSSVDGGVGGIWQIAREHDRFFETVPWSWDVTVVTGWVILLGSVFNNLFPYTASQDVVQRYLTTADERSAARAIGINALMAPLAQAMFFAIGTGLFAFYSQHPERLDVSLSNDTIFPFYIVNQMPVGVAGLLVAAIFAASQSTVSSSLNSIATAFVTDFAKRLRPEASDRRLLRIAQGVTAVVGVVGIGGALWLGQSGEIKSLWETFLAILGLFGGTISGMFLLGIFVPRANSQGALAGSITSAVVVFVVYWFQFLNFWWYGFVGITVCVVVGWLASLPFPAPTGRGGLSLVGVK
jgi:SSS family transporter